MLDVDVDTEAAPHGDDCTCARCLTALACSIRAQEEREQRIVMWLFVTTVLALFFLALCFIPRKAHAEGCVTAEQDKLLRAMRAEAEKSAVGVVFAPLAPQRPYAGLGQQPQIADGGAPGLIRLADGTVQGIVPIETAPHPQLDVPLADGGSEDLPFAMHQGERAPVDGILFTVRENAKRVAERAADREEKAALRQAVIDAKSAVPPWVWLVTCGATAAAAVGTAYIVAHH